MFVCSDQNSELECCFKARLMQLTLNFVRSDGNVKVRYQTAERLSSKIHKVKNQMKQKIRELQVLRDKEEGSSPETGLRINSDI